MAKWNDAFQSAFKHADAANDTAFFDVNWTDPCYRKGMIIHALMTHPVNKWESLKTWLIANHNAEYARLFDLMSHEERVEEFLKLTADE